MMYIDELTARRLVLRELESILVGPNWLLMGHSRPWLYSQLNISWSLAKHSFRTLEPFVLSWKPARAGFPLGPVSWPCGLFLKDRGVGSGPSWSLCRSGVNRSLTGGWRLGAKPLNCDVKAGCVLKGSRGLALSLCSPEAHVFPWTASSALFSGSQAGWDMASTLERHFL